MLRNYKFYCNFIIDYAQQIGKAASVLKLVSYIQTLTRNKRIGVGRRALALLLACIMILSCVPAQVYAEDADGPEDSSLIEVRNKTAAEQLRPAMQSLYLCIYGDGIVREGDIHRMRTLLKAAWKRPIKSKA